MGLPTFWRQRPRPAAPDFSGWKKLKREKSENWDNPLYSIFHSFKVVKDSLTQKAGLLPNDFLISVAGVEVYEMTHDQVTFNETKISSQYFSKIHMMEGQKI